MEVPDLGEYAKTDWPANQKAHAAMIARMDADIGRVLERLKKHGLDNNTVVFFSSDNGPHREGGNDPDFNDSNGPLRGIKRDLYEGGIRVPFIVRWPGGVKPGTSDFAGAFWDVMPTVAELGGVSDKGQAGRDGLSIVPTLRGTGEQKQHDHLYWAFYERGGARALRMGKWKAVEQPLGKPVQLYDLDADIGEASDVAAKHPDVVAAMTKKMDARTPPQSGEVPDAEVTSDKCPRKEHHEQDNDPPLFPCRRDGGPGWAARAGGREATPQRRLHPRR
jgi:arylsulfatase A-like enzyme